MLSGGRIIESIRTDYSTKKDFHTLEQGYKYGVSEERDRIKLDDVIEKALNKVDVAARMYPEVYSHIVSEAVIKYLNSIE